MNRDVCEHFNPVDLLCNKCQSASVQKSTLREAAQQALEYLDAPSSKLWPAGTQYQIITALRAALAEPENWELRRLREELERCKQTCAATSEAWREEATLAEPVECPHGVTDGNCKECYEAKAEPVQEPVAWYHVPYPGNGISPVVSMYQQREPSLYGAVVPLYTAPPQQALTIERLRDALVASRIIPPAAVEDPDEYDDGVTLFRIEALHRRIT